MVSEDPIKEAFRKIKHDIYSLYSELSSLKRDLGGINHEMSKISEILLKIIEKLPKKQEKFLKNHFPTNPTIQQIDQTGKAENTAILEHLPAHSYKLIDGSKREKQVFSTGNEGVPTDRQTNQQTDTHMKNNLKISQFYPKFAKIASQNPIQPPQRVQPQNPIEDAARALDSLDNLKKEIRLKFKQLTDQELMVFSALYQMEEEQGPIDYKTLALKLKLTESSIRDYIGRLLQKGIPVEKHKVNNKKILLSVSQSLKRVASLQTILQLRDL